MAMETSVTVPVETVKGHPLLEFPLTVTKTFPVTAPTGTVRSISVSIQCVGVAGIELKVTVLAPWDGPNAVPLITTEAPTAPAVGDRPVMIGAGAVVELIDTLSKVAVVGYAAE
jgi:hypothetical protein